MAEPKNREPLDQATRIHRWIVILVTSIMLLEMGVMLHEGQWMNAFLVLTIMTVILAPTIARHRLPVRIPAEFQILALIFTFAALFLGEIHRYYERIWWWDIALHGSSGLLLGILGFLLIYVMNESRTINLLLQPRFFAFFAFVFAVAVGSLWEIFEFTMDQLFGMNMQKPMLGDPSGLTDTMWDMILNTLGAATTSLFGWWYLKRGSKSFIGHWIDKFIERNPGLFKA